MNVFLLYLLWPRVTHRFVGYLEEEAIISYTDYIADIDAGKIANVAAPQFAIDYWQLSPDARLREVVAAVRRDEAKHRDVNHGFADELTGRGAAAPTRIESAPNVDQTGALPR